MAEASLKAARMARRSGDLPLSQTLALAARTHARLCYNAADLTDVQDANAVERAQKAAGEAEDGWSPAVRSTSSTSRRSGRTPSVVQARDTLERLHAAAQRRPHRLVRSW